MQVERYHALACWLLVLGVAAHFAWHAAPADLQGQAWNASNAVQQLVLLALLANAYRQRWVWVVCALLGVWQGMVAGCSLAWMVSPWPVLPNQAQCSAALDAPLGLLGLWIASILAARMWR